MAGGQRLAGHRQAPVQGSHDEVDGEVGNKKIYDPRAWGKIAETAMAARVVEATQRLGSAGKSQSA